MADLANIGNSQVGKIRSIIVALSYYELTAIYF